MGRLMRRGSLAASLALALAVLAPVGAARAADPTFGTPTIDSTFGEGIQLTQPVTVDATPFRVELLLTLGGAPPLVVEVDPPAGTGDLVLRETFQEGHILPNTPVEARWRITMGPDTPPVTGPSASTVYDDDRMVWRTLEGDVVRVHWTEGDEAFARRALDIGEDAVESTAALLGVTEDEPVDFFIYADEGEFYDALGPGTRENVGGQANTDIRTLFALITPGQIDDSWVDVVIPHELVHLVFDTAARNPYNYPPRWLNEGLATYLSQGLTGGDQAAVQAAANDGSIIPLAGLEGQFPTTADGFFLAYSESVSAVDFFIRTHGQDALLRLIDAYADGRTDDEAFHAAIGQDVATFDAAWLADLGTAVPARLGPQPAPPGPRPADWGAVAASPLPGATSGPVPAATPGTQPGTNGSGVVDADVVMPLTVIAGILALACVGLVVARRGRRAASS